MAARRAHAALDADGRALVDALVAEVVAAGTTVLLASHEVDQVASFEGIQEGLFEHALGDTSLEVSSFDSGGSASEQRARQPGPTSLTTERTLPVASCRIEATSCTSTRIPRPSRRRRHGGRVDRTAVQLPLCRG